MFDSVSQSLKTGLMSCYLVLVFLGSLVGLGEFVVELETELAFDLTLSPFLSVSGEPELFEHFDRISLRLLAAVFCSAQVGVSWKVGNRTICPGGVWEECVFADVDILYVYSGCDINDAQVEGTEREICRPMRAV